MEATLSPGKRRAVLGAKDANAALATTPNTTKIARIATPMLSTPSATTSPSIQASPEKGTKRAAEGADDSPEAKKTCVVDGTAPSRSPSIESSSLFDTSAGDASWTTAATEPERPRALTREQAREKAEILRLRLGLAGYKLRTGQTAIPLSELQRRPLPSPSITARKRACTILPHAKPTSSTHSRAQSVGSVPMLSQEEDATTVSVSASQESVVAETRGNTPDGGDSGGNESDRAALPCKVFHSSPAVVPVSSLRSTCTDTAS